MEHIIFILQVEDSNFITVVFDPSIILNVAASITVLIMFTIITFAIFLFGTMEFGQMELIKYNML